MFLNKILKNDLSSWYAVYTKPRFEKKVYATLLNNGYDCYLPLIATYRQWSDRKKKVLIPLISSYVFVNTFENNLTNILPFNGVVTILKHMKKPAIIKDYEIENLKMLLEDSDKIKTIENIDLKKGDPVLVEKGLFKGLIAEHIRYKGKYRIFSRIEALGNVIELDIPLSFIKKIQ